MFDSNHPDYDFTPVSPRRPRYNYLLQDFSSEPIVSIVTPFFNTGAIFHETARSVFAQSLQQFEWIIIDDGSTDKLSLEILRKYELADSRVKIVRQQNRGLSAARNEGFRRAKTDFVFQLDSDDLIEPTAIAKSFWYLTTHPGDAFANGFSIGFGAQEYVWLNGFHEASTFLTDNRVCPVVMVRRNVHAQVGGYDETMREGLEDWDFWLKCAEKGFWGTTIPEVTCWYRRRDDHSEKWKAWTSVGLRRFIENVRKKYPELYKNGIDTRPRTIIGQNNNWDLIGTNKLKKTRRRILLIFPWLEMGGADQFNISLIKAIKEKNWEVTIVCTHPCKHPWLSEFARETPDIFILDHFLEIADVPQFLEYLVISRGFDLVLTSQSLMGYFHVPFLKERFPALPIADYTHMVEMHWLGGGYPSVSAQNSDFFDLQIAASEQVRGWMIENGAKADCVVTRYINVSTTVFKPNEAARESWRKRLGIPRDAPVIVFPARFVPQKRPLLLLEIVRRLRLRKIADFRLICAGDGELLEAMKEFVAKHRLGQTVLFVGPQSNSAVAELFAASDILVLPSSYEGIALAIYEAMAAGIAVLASDVGGQSELVTRECGELVKLRNEEEDAESFVAVLSGWLRDPQSIKRMGMAGRDIVARKFDLALLGSQMESAFEIAIAKAKTRPKAVDTAKVEHARSTATKHSETYWSYIWRMNWPAGEARTHSGVYAAWTRLFNLLWVEYWSASASIRTALRPYKKRLNRLYRLFRGGAAALRRHKEQWQSGKSSELEFWRNVIFNTGVQPQAYHDEFMECAKPRDFREDLLRYLPRSARDKVRILDVAAGPLSCLGNRLQPHTLDITAVDVLAAEYNELLAEARIDPPVKTSLCEAEQIHKKFPANSFDLAFIRNALDHCYDPMTVIRNVYFVLKPGGFFVIEGFINQAEFENYGGLHQWNIDYQENQLVISSKTNMFEIPRGLDLPFDLSVPIYDPGSRWIKAVLHKRDEAMCAA